MMGTKTKVKTFFQIFTAIINSCKLSVINIAWMSANQALQQIKKQDY